MKKLAYHYRSLSITSVLLCIIILSFFAVSPALALDFNPQDYFQLTYDSPSLDKSAVTAGETFHVAIHGTAVCIKDLPISISELSITSKIIARPAAGGSDLTLNPQYIIDIKPLPNKAGGSFSISQNITLQFPNGSTSGDYTVIGQLTKAQVKVLVWIGVTGSFPKEQEMGKVKCVIPSTYTMASSATSAIPILPHPSSTSTVSSITASPPNTTLTSSANPTRSGVPVNAFLVIAVIVTGLVAIILVTVVIVLVHRRRS